MTYTDRLAEVQRFREVGMHDLADIRALLIQRDVLEQLASEGNALARLVVVA